MNRPVSIGNLGLFIPFLIVFVAVMFTGHHPAQLAGAAILLVVPAVIITLRHRAARKPT